MIFMIKLKNLNSVILLFRAQPVQLRTEGRENGDVGAVAP
jgi:hypothetical protein